MKRIFYLILLFYFSSCKITVCHDDTVPVSKKTDCYERAVDRPNADCCYFKMNYTLNGKYNIWESCVALGQYLTPSEIERDIHLNFESLTFTLLDYGCLTQKSDDKTTDSLYFKFEFSLLLLLCLL